MTNHSRSDIRKLLPVLLLCAHVSVAQTDCPLMDGSVPDDWTAPYPAHRVIGPVYAVGNAGLGVYLIATPDGHILINTGLENSTAQIRDSIDSVGYRLRDVRILLAMQAHWDHTAALAEIKAITGAEMWATADDARVLEDGGASDPLLGGCTMARFRPVTVDRILTDGEVIEIGGIRITVHEHPGHTQGSSSYSMTVTEGGRDYRVLIANMGSINPGLRLTGEPTYPGVADDYAGTFRKQRAMDVDVWVAAHGSQYGLSDKHAPGQPYSPDTFVDPEGFIAAVERLEQIYLDQMNAEQIRALRLQSNQAIAKHDPEAIRSFLDEDFVITISTGAIERSRDEHIGSFEQHFTDFPDVVYTRTPVSVTISKDYPLAIEQGTWVGTRTTGNGKLENGGQYTAAWRMTDGGWKIYSELFVALYCDGVDC